MSHSDAAVRRPEASLDWAHPIVREWFVGRFGTPTEPQIEGWPHILAGRDALISAPTGSGKTLAAFLACIDRLVRQALEGALEDRTQVLYISPLKALGNDVQKNLDGPLAEILALAAERGLPMPEIRTAVRTGDTLMPARQAMLRTPPHILVTTPESLYILLTSDKSRDILRRISTVIVDEIHAVADDKRGAHLAISLERLDALVGRIVPRIGLSATQKPIEVIGQFLVGAGRPAPVIVQISSTRRLDLAVEVPSSELGPVASNVMWEEIYDRLAELVRQHRSTIIFVNTRRHAERISHHLAERLGHDAVAAHHGSLARKIRLAAEQRLKTGEVNVIVATASLELGIDVGTVDLVCQIGSPRSIATAVQRIGRAGHWRGAIPKGRLFATTRDDLIESAALVLAIRRGELDRIIIPDAPLDILAQQIVATCAADDWPTDDLFAFMRRAYPYRALTRQDFDEVVEMLSEGIAARRGRYGAYLHHDKVNRVLRARRGGRLAAITGGGAIPETAVYQVVAEPEGINIGTVDEDFAVESLAGDIVLLGNASWRIRRVAMGRVIVEDAHGAAPNVPFWNGEAPSRTIELSQHVSEVRQQIGDLVPDIDVHALGRLAGPSESSSRGTAALGGGASSASNRREQASSVDAASTAAGQIAPALSWLMDQCGLDRSGAEQAIDYVLMGRAVLGAVPTQQTLIAERFFDEGGGMQLLIHAPFGARINKAWGLALRKRFCRSFNFELQAAATDNGINISLAEQHSFPLADVFNFLHTNSVQHVLEQAVLPAPVFAARWRWDASRSLALQRFRAGKRVPLHIQRMMSDDLLASVFPDAAACPENLEGEIEIPNHPLIREVMKDVLTEAMDIDGLKALLDRIADGSIRCLSVDTPVPSPFSHEILNANPYAYLDDAPLEERRARAVELRRSLPASVQGEVGRLDPAAIAEVVRDAWPDVRDADELSDVLQTLTALPAGSGNWTTLYEELAATRRATTALAHGRAYWVAAERVRTFSALFSDVSFGAVLPDVEAVAPTREKALLATVRGWMAHVGPITADELADRLGLSNEDVDDGLLRLEASGAILRGSFRPPSGASALGKKTSSGATAPAAAAPSESASRGVAALGGGAPSASIIEWCDRRLLARIHRLTLGALRREIEPVTTAQFMRWLFRWQHVASGTQLAGERGTLDVLQQLQGFEAPANAWEPQLLAGRIARYDPKVLDDLCLTGAVGWGRLSPHPATVTPPEERKSASTAPGAAAVRRTPAAPAAAQPGESSSRGEAAREGGTTRPPMTAVGRRIVPTSVAPVTFFVRDDSDWMTPLRSREVDDDVRSLSPQGQDALQFLRRTGASFFPDIVRGTGRLKAEIETALWELVAAGLVTADGFDNLRALVDPRRRAGHGSGRTTRPRHSAGRWSLLHSATHDASDRIRVLEATCSMLLRRYGVVFRELLAREAILPKWRELLITFRRLEDRGEVRGGRFVSGCVGEQFALPIAVESLRASRHMPATGEIVTISVADPLNLVGILLPGERVPAIPGRFVRFKDGVPVGREIDAPPMTAAS